MLTRHCAAGKDDTDQDGPALVGDPDLGFMALRNFGNALISHVNLKVVLRISCTGNHEAACTALFSYHERASLARACKDIARFCGSSDCR